MVTINLRDFYPWYTHDVYAEVPEEVATELCVGRLYDKIHNQRTRRNRSYYSLDAADGIEALAVNADVDEPEVVLGMTEQHCALCRALNSLPEIQGRRIEARYIIGKSQREIAESEGVSDEAVSKAIEKGLLAMKKYLKEID